MTVDAAAPMRRARPGPAFDASTALVTMRAMEQGDLDAVMAIEREAYPLPWTIGNFADSVRSGYWARLRLDRGELVGYLVAMAGVAEVHLLNLTVAPPQQGRGHGRAMLEGLAAQARALHAETLWLEVRQGNLRAQDLYRRFGFETVGLRKRYYPAQGGGREDAIVMSLKLNGACDAPV
jgi:ribosomal-protein-alanine N-acetyltransferase